MIDTEGHSGSSGSWAPTILVVEDNKHVREALVDTITGLGYRVLEANNARRALDIVNQTETRIDLVVSDLVMPGMNALELYEALKTKAYGGKMLVVTGYPMPHAGTSLAQRPGVAWAEKPVRLDELRLLLAQLLEQPLV